MSVFFSILMRVIIGILLGSFLVALIVMIPAYLLGVVLQSLIGRPFGQGWMRVEAKVTGIDTAGLPQNLAQMNLRLPDFQVAVYEADGQEYRTALTGKYKKDTCTLYVKRSDPEKVWQPKCPNALTALVGVIFVLGLWAGLIYAGIRIFGAVRS